MIATLVISEPAGLAAALVAAGTALFLQSRRLAPDSENDADGQTPRLRRLIPILIITPAAGIPLLAGGNANTVLILAVATVVIWLSIRTYRHAETSRAARLLLAGLRITVWAVLLVLLARPAWQRIVYTWDKPVIAILLDHSASMGITDDTREETPRNRAQVANAALAAATPAYDLLRERYDVRLLKIGPRAYPAHALQVGTNEPLSAIAAGLGEARSLRSGRGRAPVAVLIVSDGAENAAPIADLRRAADDLMAQRTPLIAVGVGPAPGKTPLVELDGLVLPPRVRVRDLLHIPITGRAQGCMDHPVRIELAWDEQVMTQETITPTRTIQPLATALDTLPPSPGVHRLTVRAVLPNTLGGHEFSKTTVVDVVTDKLRILWIESQPRQESAFALRAWRQDDMLEVSRELILDTADVGRVIPVILNHDVIVLGQLGPRPPAELLSAIATAVTERGAGLLIASGRGFLNSRGLEDSELATICPVQPNTDRFGRAGPLKAVPTEAGLRHPILLQPANGTGNTAGPTPDSPRAVWDDLPPLGGAAWLGTPKPAASVLATDEEDHPLLVAQEAGRGRCVVAAWETTWPWALASENGYRLHQHYWRQMATWLANRRPQAWLLTDSPTYPLAPLAASSRTVQVRAGIAGLNTDPEEPGRRRIRAKLVLHRANKPDAPPVEIPLNTDKRKWTADLTAGTDASPGPTEAGTYTLELTVQVAHRDKSGKSDRETYHARTQFTVESVNLESRPPTANLPLMRALAERTSACGGMYIELSDLPATLEKLAARDQRERVPEPTLYDPIRHEPWPLFILLVTLLGTEWAIRKRAGLL